MPTVETDAAPIIVGEGEPENDAKQPECHVSDCGRPGVVVRKIHDPKARTSVSGSGEAYDHYVCRCHHRLFLGIKAGLAMFAVGLFIWTVYASI